MNKNEVQGIYRVSKGGSEGEKITSDYGDYLNVSGSYLYYLNTEEGDIVRVKTNGANKELVVENVNNSIPVTVHNGWIYYAKEEGFYRIKTNVKNEEKICDKSIRSYQIDGNLVYYSYIEGTDKIISKMKLNGDKKEEVGKGLGDAFYVKGSTIYYILDPYDQVEARYNYELCSIKTNGKNQKSLLKLEDMYNTDFINMNDKGIYYLREDQNNYTICYMNYNGEGKKDIIAIEGNATPINVVDNWIFYVDVNEDDISMYKVRTDGKNKQAI